MILDYVINKNYFQVKDNPTKSTVRDIAHAYFHKSKMSGFADDFCKDVISNANFYCFSRFDRFDSETFSVLKKSALAIAKFKDGWHFVLSENPFKNIKTVKPSEVAGLIK